MFQHQDPNLFYLVLQLTDTNPSQEGLTRKTVSLDNESKVVDYVPCQEWFDTKGVFKNIQFIYIFSCTAMQKDWSVEEIFLKYSLLVHIETEDGDAGEDIPECPNGGQGLCADETEGSCQNGKKKCEIFQTILRGVKPKV